MIAPRISYSAARALEECPRRYALSHTAVLPGFQAALHLGQALHVAAAEIADLSHKSGCVPGLDEAAPFLTAALEKLPITRNHPTRQILEGLFYEGLPKLDLFRCAISPRLRKMQRLEVEKWTQVCLEEAQQQVVVSGRIDLLFFDPFKSRLVILDIKTGRIPEKFGSNPQLAAYIAATRADPAIVAEFGPHIPIDAFAVYLEPPSPVFFDYDQATHFQPDLAYLHHAGTRAFAMTKFPACSGLACGFCAYFEHCHADST